jgi:hypothetical protein
MVVWSSKTSRSANRAGSAMLVSLTDSRIVRRNDACAARVNIVWTVNGGKRKQRNWKLEVARLLQ